jgi:Domain of unknown function (DUF1929)
MPWKLSADCPINPVHAALLRTNKVLFFSGSGNDPNNIVNSDRGAVIWDIQTETFSSNRPIIPRDIDGSILDIFCAGQSFRPDGKLFVVGGTKQYDPFKGLTASFVYDPASGQEKWTRIASMNQGRWYPTVLSLGDGRIFAITGTNENGSLSLFPEIFSSATGWQAFSEPFDKFPLYAHLFLLEDGRLFYSGAQFFSNNGLTPRLIAFPSNFSQKFVQTPVSGLQDIDFGNQAASVLLPPAQEQKVMIIGGGNPSNRTATKRVNIVNLKASNPSYTSTAPLKNARMHHNAVLLPDRTVFVCNGSGKDEKVDLSNIEAEIYNPATKTWTAVEKPGITGRVYHSVALLLPDGRVLAAGGNPTRGSYQTKMEIYSPGYMSQPRPVIQNSFISSTYGGTFTIQTPTNQGTIIRWAHLIQPMATTHGLDTSQRLVDLPITSRTSNSLTVQVTNNRNIAPPGYYMVFIVDNNNIPSIGKWIRIK